MNIQEGKKNTYPGGPSFCILPLFFVLYNRYHLTISRGKDETLTRGWGPFRIPEKASKHNGEKGKNSAHPIPAQRKSDEGKNGGGKNPWITFSGDSHVRLRVNLVYLAYLVYLVYLVYFVCLVYLVYFVCLVYLVYFVRLVYLVYFVCLVY